MKDSNGVSWMDRFYERSFSQFIRGDETAIICPANGCENMMSIELDGKDYFECEVCEKTFCIKCK